MKSYKEMADEALRRRDAYIKNREKQMKKTAMTACIIVATVLVGGGSWFISSHITDEPNKPAAQTTAAATADTVGTANTEDSTYTSATERPNETELHSETEELTSESLTADSEDTTETVPYTPPTEAQPYVPLPPDTTVSRDTTSFPQTDEPQESTEPVEIPTSEATTAAPLTEATTDPAELSTPPMPGRPAVKGETNKNTAAQKEPVPLDSTVSSETEIASGNLQGTPNNGYGEATDIGTDSIHVSGPALSGNVLHYSIDFDVEDYFFIDENTVIPETVPVYMLDKAATPSADDQLRSFTAVLYGEDQLYTCGSFSDEYEDPIFFANDEWLADTRFGRYISTDSENNSIYFTLDLTEHLNGGKYSDMTAVKAFEYLGTTAHYAAAVEYLGIKNVMVNTEILRYYSDNSCEYRFHITEKADNIFDAEYNYTAKSFTVSMTFSPETGTAKARFDITGPVVLKEIGTAVTVSYAEASELLLEKYSASKYSAAYRNALKMTIKYTYELVSGVRIISPYYCYYMGYADIDGSESYYEDNGI